MNYLASTKTLENIQSSLRWALNNSAYEIMKKLDEINLELDRRQEVKIHTCIICNKTEECHDSADNPCDYRECFKAHGTCLHKWDLGLL